MENHRQTGSYYERIGAAYLCNQGLEIVELNYRCRRGEIDIIAREASYLVFVEVKYRSDLSMGDPLDAVTPGKQRKIRTTAEYYLYQHGMDEEIPCRFDVIGILGNNIHWIKNAF